MYKEENPNHPTKISIESWGDKHETSINHSDVDINEMLEAIYILLIQASWPEQVILYGMKEFAEEKMKGIIDTAENIKNKYPEIFEMFSTDASVNDDEED